MKLENHNLAVASLKTQRISAFKARLVAVLLKGKKVSDALAILAHTKKKASPIFTKLINSAVANAINNHGFEHSNLIIKAAIVNEGPTLKRFRPRAKGAASQILKRTSHFKVILVSQNTGESQNQEYQETEKNLVTKSPENTQSGALSQQSQAEQPQNDPENGVDSQLSAKTNSTTTAKKTDLADNSTKNDATNTVLAQEKEVK
ncbi:50S ribosomal protein L22 [Mycoplasma hyopneumoniae]|uniref:50S ribosomal protein L22 n=1 Tax=Mesomycoplasma hyopneumoniae TaxID=2099 RepID=UPI00136A7850|nr:50S ribosomal protein L22 [Mesomycoplasma hyopneumoniae]